jgi:hypothetical protein
MLTKYYRFSKQIFVEKPAKKLLLHSINNFSN